jgi:hypothetical protein
MTEKETGIFLIRALIPFIRLPLSRPNHLPEALPKYYSITCQELNIKTWRERGHKPALHNSTTFA